MKKNVTYVAVLIITTLTIIFVLFGNHFRIALSVQEGMRSAHNTSNARLKGIWGDTKRMPLRSEADPSDYYINSVSFSPDGRKVLSAGALPGMGYYESGVIDLWDVSGKLIRTLKGHTREVNSVAFSRDGLRAASASTDGTVRLWNLETGTGSGILKRVAGELNVAWAVAFHPDGQKLLIGLNENPTLKLIDIHTGKEIQTYDISWNVRKICLSRDGKRALSICTYEVPTIWDVPNGEPIRKLEKKRSFSSYFAMKGAWICGSLSRDGRIAIAGGSDGSIHLWEVESGQEKWSKSGHKGSLKDISFFPDGKSLVSTGDDGATKLWNSLDGRLTDRVDLTEHKDIGLSVDCSPDGRSFVVGTRRGFLFYYELEQNPGVGNGQNRGECALAPKGITTPAAR